MKTLYYYQYFIDSYSSSLAAVIRSITFIVLLSLLFGCTESEPTTNSVASPAPSQHYQSVPASASGIQFANNIRETANFNYFLYPFIYFGGGVAIGDINNDSLPDIYFTSNMGLNTLYLNQGNMRFQDITQSAGVEGVYNRWTTGVTMVDINNDRYLDLYVSVAGPREEHRNLLYVNQQDNTFKEQAEQWGVADPGHTIQSAFFDYDRDGDLDLYVGNYPPAGFSQTTDFFAAQREAPEASESDKLYRNEGSHFVDVTAEAGLLNYGLTLGLSVTDVNNDDWPDLYVSNDFNSSDYLYINQGDGTFEDQLTAYAAHTSNFGMGTDAADINNDGRVDLIQADMMGATNEQQKANMSAMNPEQFYHTVAQGLHYQYMKNTLQLSTGKERWLEIGELAGVAYTDWSWGPLLLDMNNDGHKDIFITNGMRRNVNDNDFNAYFRIQQEYQRIDPTQYMSLLQKIPVRPVRNAAFLNQGNLSFEAANRDYGLSYAGFSQGAAYGDLDQDGDLDLVVNNLDSTASLLENVSPAELTHYLRFRLVGTSDNSFGIGASVWVYTDSVSQYQELQLTRGYESSVEPIVHVGLGEATVADSVRIVWPNGTQQWLHSVAADRVMEIRQQDAVPPSVSRTVPSPLFTTHEPTLSPSFVHQENEYDDFAREVLLPHRMSQFGPALATADVNADGRDDFYVGGAAGAAGALYVQQSDGSFRSQPSALWQQDRAHEDVDALFFDANGDELPDLYVVSGGNEFATGEAYYQDRLYVNNGRGEFSRSSEALPRLRFSGSCVRAADMDQDGDQDLFVGGRQVPGQYPQPADSYVWRNDSDAQQVLFTDVTEEVAPQLQKIGMVTDASWVDLESDGWPDLVIVGEWMPVILLNNESGVLRPDRSDNGLANQVGWWGALAVGDVDNDGDPDLVVGNVGLNYKYHASPQEPFKVFADDFDQNGRLDIVLGYYNQGELFPLRGRECSSQQIPAIKKKFPNYTAFSQASLVDVYSPEQLENALHYEATTFASQVFLNQDGQFTAQPLPRYAQASSINAIVLEDVNNDSYIDLIVAGNQYDSEVETPRNDASMGLVLIGNGQGQFSALPPESSGIEIPGETQKIVPLTIGDNQLSWLVGRNNGRLMIFHQRVDSSSVRK